MADQTEAQVQSEINARVAILHEILKLAGVNSSGNLSNFIAREETALDIAAGDHTTDSDAALRANVRNRLSSILDPASARSVLDPLLRNYARVDGAIPDASIDSIIDRLYRRFIDNALTVNSRGITYGAISAGSNLGNGTINRLTKDSYGYNIEACHIESKRADCVRDSASGAALHEEVFLFRGATRRPNPSLYNEPTFVIGSGVVQEVPCLSSNKSPFTNSSFSNFAGTSITALTSVSGWTVGSAIANFNLDQTNFYRSAGGTTDATPASLKFLTNDSMFQPFSGPGVQLDEKTPYYIQIAYNREVGSCDGTLTLTVGAISVSVALSAQTGWNILRIPLDKSCWARNLLSLSADDTTTPVDTPYVRVQLSGRTTGTLLVDDFVFGPFIKVDGLWYAPVGGATPFAGSNRDSFTWSDTVATDAVIQKWLALAYKRYLPHNNAGAETWADPSV